METIEITIAFEKMMDERWSTWEAEFSPAKIAMLSRAFNDGIIFAANKCSEQIEKLIKAS